MAINASAASITISTANTTTRTGTITLTNTLSSSYYYSFSIVADGKAAAIASGGANGNNGTVTLSYSFTHSNLLTQLDGASSLRLKINLSENLSGNTISTSTVYATVSISLRNSNLSVSNYNLDTGGTLTSSWTKPSTHSGWRTQVEIFVNGTTTNEFIFRVDTSGSSTSTTPSSAQLSTMESLMGGVSPGTITARIWTRWSLSGGVTNLGSATTTSTITKTFFTPITISTPSINILSPLRLSFTVSTSGGTNAGKFYHLQYRLNSGSWIDIPGYGNSASAYNAVTNLSTTLSGLVPSTSYNVQVRAKDLDGNYISSSTSASQTTIGIPTVSVSSDFTIGNNSSTATVTIPSGVTSYTNTLFIDVWSGTAWVQRNSKNVTTSGNFTDAEYNSGNDLYTYTRYSSDTGFRYRLSSIVNGDDCSAYSQTSAERKAIVSSTVLPTLGSSAIVENNSSAVYGIDGGQTLTNIVSGIFVQNHSQAKVNLTNIAAGLGARINYVQVSLAGFNNIVIYSSEQTTTPIPSASASFGTLATSGTINGSIFIRDTRNRSITVPISLSVTAYSPPTIIGYNVNRCNVDGSNNPVGSYLKWVFTPSFSNVTVTPATKNRYRVSLNTSPFTQYFLSTATNNIGTSLITGYYTTTSFADSSTFSIKLEVWDNFTNSSRTTQIDILPTAMVPISFSKDGIGIMKIRENGALDVGGDIYSNNEKQQHIVKFLTSGVDLNTIVETGSYRLSSSHTNAPSGHDYGQMLVIRGAGDTIAQLLFPYNNDNVWRRSGNPTNVGGVGSWRPWINLGRDTTIYSDADTYRLILGKNGSTSDYIRTPSNGLIPFTSGGSGSVGTSAWPFSTIYANTIYEGGTALSSKYIPSTASSSSWGSYNISTTKGGYSGFHFTNGGNTFMVRDSDGLSGIMKPSGWAWYFDTNGRLTAGSVPWSLVTGQPSVIHSSGSNANGRWLRFTNGIQICWHLDGTGIATSNATTPVRWNARAFTFPAAFTATPSISPAIFRSTNSFAWSGIQEESATGCSLYILSPYSTTGFIRYIAIGTW